MRPLKPIEYYSLRDVANYIGIEKECLYQRIMKGIYGYEKLGAEKLKCGNGNPHLWCIPSCNLNIINELRDRETCNKDNLKTMFSWDSLREMVLGCVDCKLCEKRKNVVFGDGNTDAKLLIIGEAPGAEDDVSGIPFSGKAGMLLTSMLKSIKIDRGDVYVTNILKCRPPGNRSPEDDEISSCFRYLEKQIEMIDPNVILTLGSFAARVLLKSNKPMTHFCNKVLSYGNKVNVVTTYHPAFLLRSPSKKKESWKHLTLAKNILEEYKGKGSNEMPEKKNTKNHCNDPDVVDNAKKFIGMVYDNINILSDNIQELSDRTDSIGGKDEEGSSKYATRQDVKDVREEINNQNSVILKINEEIGRIKGIFNLDNLILPSEID